MPKVKFERADNFVIEREVRPKWLIDDLIPAGAIVLVSGHQKRGKKTFLTLTLSMSIASGKCFELIRPTLRAPILFVEEEGPRYDLQNRLCDVDKFFSPGSCLANVYVAFHQHLHLDNPDAIKIIVAQAKAVEAKLVVLDALTYLHTGDPNSERDMQRVIAGLSMIRDSLDGGSVVIIHHLDKAHGGESGAHIDRQVRGSTVIVGAYDTHLACRCYGKQPFVTLEVIHRAAPEAQYLLDWQFSKTNLVGLKMTIKKDNPPQTKLEVEPP